MRAEPLLGPPPSLPARAGVEARALARAAGLTLTLAEVLRRRGLADPEVIEPFLAPKLAQMSSPEQMMDRAAAAARLAQALAERQAMVVYGDYDCDGITSTALLTEGLRALGGAVTPMLASRFEGGYGVSPAAVARILASGARLLVTCDCGSSDHESLRVLGSAGVEVIVIDHHLVPEEPLPALAFLNPHRPGCGFPFKGMASCGLALSVLAAVRAKLGVALDVRRWLDLVAIGTIADVAPLTHDNRALVRAGLERLANPERPGLRALMRHARFEGGEPLGAQDVAFRLAPRLNAPGRLGSPEVALRLLLATTEEEAEQLATEVEALQLARRHATEQMCAEAEADVEREGWAARPAIVVGREGWNHGIVGIVAGRLAERYGRPVMAVGFQGGHGHGSVRGPRGSRLFDAVSACAAELLRFGGHQAAAGLELRLERLPALRERFEQAIAEQSSSAAATPSAAEPVWLEPEDEPRRVVSELYRLEPCGEGNPPPTLLLEARVLRAQSVKGGHLKLSLEHAGTRLSAFGLGAGALAAQLGERVLAAGALGRDGYVGGDALELKLAQLYAPVC